MTISARLEAKTQLALARYCKARGITKTQALERGIKLLLQEEDMEHHPAYSAFLRMQNRLTAEKPTTSSKTTSTSRQQKEDLDAKYPG